MSEQAAVFQNSQDEMHVLAAALAHDGNRDRFIAILRPEDFTNDAGKVIAHGIHVAHDQGRKPDPRTFHTLLEKSPHGRDFGGYKVLQAMIASCPKPLEDMDALCERVRFIGTKDRAFLALTEAAEIAANPGDDIGSIRDAVDKVNGILDSGLRDDSQGFLTVAEVNEQYRQTMRDRIAGKGFSPTGLAPLDECLMEGFLPGRMTAIAARPSIGKALSLDTLVPTVSGWKRMGDLAVGDQVFGADGLPTSVVGVTAPMFGRTCYEVLFSDGESIVADENHLWDTVAVRRTRKEARAGLGARRLRTTEELSGGYRCKGGTHHRYRVPVCEPVRFGTASLPVPPYTFGYWLGDGHSDAARVTISLDDSDEVVSMIEAELVPVSRQASGKAEAVLLGLSQGRRGCGRKDTVQNSLRGVGVLGGKHIPDIYLRSSVEQRMALLKGLMDSDGSVSKLGNCEFSNTNETLVDGVVELLRSLGYKPVKSYGDAVLNGERVGAKYRVNFPCSLDRCCFGLNRKRNRLKSHVRSVRTRSVVGVRRVESVAVRCIQVSASDGMFLAGRGFIPTHNSTFLANLAYRTASLKIGSVAVFSNEAPAVAVWDKFNAISTGIPLERLAKKAHTLTPAEKTQLDAVMRMRETLPLEINESKHFSVSHMEDVIARRHREGRQFNVVFVDLFSRASEFEDTHTRGGHAPTIVLDQLKRCQQIADRYQFHAVLLIQMGRYENEGKAAGRGSRGRMVRPVESKIYGADAYQQVVDNIFLLHNCAHYDPVQYPESILEVWIRKQRYGEVTMRCFDFDRETGRVGPTTSFPMDFSDMERSKYAYRTPAVSGFGRRRRS